MGQGALPFQYVQEKGWAGVTGHCGLAVYLDLWQVAGLNESVARHLGANQGRQGWTNAQMVTSLVLLNLAGGECVEDLRLLEKDEGLGRPVVEAGGDSWDAPEGAPRAAGEVAQGTTSQYALGLGGVPVSEPVPR